MKLTKAGLWFLVMIGILALASTNTGNNGLYLVLAMMLGILVLSPILAAANTRRIAFKLEAPVEVFARQPAEIEIGLENRGFLPRWLLLVGLGGDAVDAPVEPLLVGYLARRGKERGSIGLRPERRGRYRFAGLSVASFFPLGFFRHERRYEVESEVLVYPQILPNPRRIAIRGGGLGEEPARRPGEGHGLFGLRSYRPGDDPRRIHWKQSARLGDLVSKQRERDENRRLTIVLDNAILKIGQNELDPHDDERFERLVSEAATTALDLLGRGFDVGLITRDAALPTAGGPRQRHRLLEMLALVEATTRASAPLGPVDGRPHLLLALDAVDVPETGAAPEQEATTLETAA